MKHHLYVCSTSYTIYNSINAVLSDFNGSFQHSDLVVFARTKDLIGIVDRIKELHIFENVYCYEFINNKSVWDKLLILLFPRKGLEAISINNNKSINSSEYDVIISQSNLYALLFKRINKKMDVYLIEDGLSSYTNRTSNPKQRSVLFKLASRLLGYRSEDYKGQLLYNKKMYMNYDKSEIFTLEKPNAQTMDVLKEVFSEKRNHLYSENKFVYLGTPLNGLRKLLDKEDFNGEFEEYSRQKLIECLSQFKSTVIYRRHPIETDEYEELAGNIIFDEENNMWELEVFSLINDNSVLISFFSSASLTPKLLYEKEPYLVFLYKILGVKFYNADNVIMKIRECYRDKSKILVPESIIELSQMVKKLEEKG